MVFPAPASLAALNIVRSRATTHVIHADEKPVEMYPFARLVIFISAFSFPCIIQAYERDKYQIHRSDLIKFPKITAKMPYVTIGNIIPFILQKYMFMNMRC